MQKHVLRDAIVAQLGKELELLTRAAHESRDEATSVENKAEGKYDMRSQEAAYLAEGQARLATELAEAISLYQLLDLPAHPDSRPAGLGCVVTLETKGQAARYFIGPRHGGLEIEAGGLAFTVVTPSSPLGRQLIGRHLGAAVDLPGRRGSIPHEITAID